MSLATLSGQTVTTCAVQIPSWGVPWADVEIDQPTQLSGSVSLVVADLTMAMTVVSGGPWQGRARYRLAGGAGKWGNEIPAKGYSNDAGVKAARVIADAASACGETVGDLPTGTVGLAWTRDAAPASCVLNRVSSESWYVDAAGVTQFGTRASSTYSGSATRLPSDIAAGRVELAAEELSALLPGVVVDGVTAADVHHHVTDRQQLRTTIWGALQSDTSRRVTAWRKIFDSLSAASKWRGVWEYRVVSQVGERLNLQSTKASSKLPDLLRVRVRPGVPGARADHALGSLVLVAFVNSDPGRPVVVAFDDADSPGFVPTALELGAAPRLGVARIGDTVQCGPWSGVITGGSATVKAGL